MQESATLNAGHGCANGTCRSKSKKSITCPYSKRSVRFPSTPASNSASEISRQKFRVHQSDFGRSAAPCSCRPKSNTRANNKATHEIAIKKVLLFLNEPKAAPVLVMLTKWKKSGTTTTGWPGSIECNTQYFVTRS